VIADCFDTEYTEIAEIAELAEYIRCGDRRCAEHR
jgi:hypothetical protein